MFEMNGFVYGGYPADTIKITDVKPLDDMIMILTFSSGERRLFDATILEGSVFEKLKDNEVFKNCSIEFGVVRGWMVKLIVLQNICISIVTSIHKLIIILSHKCMIWN